MAGLKGINGPLAAGNHAILLASTAVAGTVPGTSGGSYGGSVTVTPAAVPAAAYGPLTASGRYFVDVSGNPVIVAGPHTWTNMQNIDTTNFPGESNGGAVFGDTAFDQLLDADGLNASRFWIWDAMVDGGGTYGPVSPTPWVVTNGKADLTQINPALTARVRSVAQRFIAGQKYPIIQAGANGTSYYVTTAGTGWPANPFHVNNNSNGIDGANGGSDGTYALQQTSGPIWSAHVLLLHAIIDAVYDLPEVILEVPGNELADDGATRAFRAAMIAEAKSYLASKGSSLLVTTSAPFPPYTSNADANSWQENSSGAAAYSLAGTIYTATSGNQAGYNTPNEPVADGAKPIIWDSDHVIGGGAWDPMDAFMQGYAVLLDMESMAGIAGSLIPNSTGGSVEAANRAGMGLARKLAGLVSLNGCSPQPGLVGNASGVRCLANPSTGTYLVYGDTSPTVNLSGFGSQLGYRTLGSDGTVSAASQVVTNGSAVQFSVPSGGVLIIQPASVTLTAASSGSLSPLPTTGVVNQAITGTYSLTNASSAYVRLRVGGVDQGSPVQVTGASGSYSLTPAAAETCEAVLTLDQAGTQVLWTSAAIVVAAQQQQGGGSGATLTAGIMTPATAPAGALTVGAGQQYATLAAAVAAAPAGATIAVKDTATYTNDWPGSISQNLTITAFGGGALPVFTFTGNPPNQKAFLDHTGGTGLFEYLEIENVHWSTDQNGAGIRNEGANTTLRFCHIHDCDMGVLGGSNASAYSIAIDQSEINNCGVTPVNGNPNSHNIYCTGTAAGSTFSLTNSYVHDAFVGHEVKVRAPSATITGNRILGNQGTDSYTIDIPQGGTVNISNNVIEQSGTTQNPIIVAYGEEVPTVPANPGTAITFNNNTVVNDHGQGSDALFFVKGGTITALGNTLYGLTSAQLSANSSPVPANSGYTYVGTRPTTDTTPMFATATGGTEAITLAQPSAQEAGASFQVSGTIVNPPASPALQTLLGGTALSGTATLANANSTFTFLVPGQGAGTISLQMKDSTTGVLSNTVSVQVSAAVQAGTPGALPVYRHKAVTNLAVGDPGQFGHTFAYGTVPAGSFNKLTLTAPGGQVAQVQTGGTNAWPDGSLRFARCSFHTPVAIAAGSIVGFQLGIGSADYVGNGPTATRLAAMSDIRVQGTGAGSVGLNGGGNSTAFDSTYEVNVNQVLANGPAWNGSAGYGANPASGYEQLDNGPACSLWRVWSMARRTSDGAYDRNVKLTAYLTAWSDGAGGISGVEVYGTVRQPDLYGPHPAGTTGSASTSPMPCYRNNYSIVDEKSGTTLFSTSNILTAPGSVQVLAPADAGTVWLAGTRSGGKPQYLQGPDATYAISTRVMPIMDTSLAGLEPNDTAVSQYNCGFIGISDPISGSNFSATATTGDSAGDERIGLLNGSSVTMLLNPFNAYRDVRQKSYAFLTMAYYFAWDDERTGRPLGRTPVNYPGLIPNPSLYFINGNAAGNPAWGYGGVQSVDPLNFNLGYGDLLDTSHMPSHWVVPYYRTGHPIFVDLGLHQTITMLASIASDCVDWPYGPVSPSYNNMIMTPNAFPNQVRGYGWANRQLGFTECLLPDADPHRQLIKDSMDTNSQWIEDVLASNYIPSTVVALGLLPYWKSQSNKWQPYMMAYHGAGLGLNAWREALSGTRPGFAAWLNACKPALVDMWDDNNGGTSYLLDDYIINVYPGGPNAPANDDMTGAYGSLADMRSANLSACGISSLPVSSPAFQYTSPSYFKGNSTPPPAGSQCFAGSVAAGVSSVLAYLALLGVPNARNVYNQARARMTNAAAGETYPTWVYTSAYGETETAASHSLVIPPGL